MKLELYQVDAFTDHIFGGNPACVVPLISWLPDELLLQIAGENAVAETAFYIQNKDYFDLRWFTAEIEMDLCGHATLATAHVIKTIKGFKSDTIMFNTLSGELEVTSGDGSYTLNFPARKPIITILPEVIKTSLGTQPNCVLKARDYLLVYDREEDVKNININRDILNHINLGPGGIIITARGNDCDFVSRFFTPQASIFEDPVTGSAHCSLIPYWSEQLNKTTMFAKQISSRTGKLHCVLAGERVLISGQARTYFMGSFWTT